MSGTTPKHIKKSEKYKGVYISLGFNNNLMYCYRLTINNNKFVGYFSTEYEAAKQYDIKLIENGKQPVNVLKPKALQ